MSGPPAPVPPGATGPAPVPGRPDQLLPGLVRLTAPNPGMMTGPGTNTYLVGTADLAVVDPGPDDDGHRAAILAAAGSRPVRWVLVTHTHPDHAPGAAPLARACGAEIVGFDARDGFVPDRTAGEGWTLAVPPYRVRAVHTPGHASNHLCWLLEEPRLLLSGDHVMQGSTVVIRPPDGDMSAYLDSLRQLRRLDPPLAAIAPGHGRLIDQPAAVVDAIVTHRLQRQEMVARALAAAGHATVDQLLPVVYVDVDADRYPVARNSLWAHLRKLAADGRAVLADDAGRAALADDAGRAVLADGAGADGTGADGAGADGAGADEIDRTWSATPATAP
ncbi:MAG TPA: MBL fold metallo-hydrolase [Acidimicrobiales bacterium]|nr:MBL fold metallo-hydrolase [Acidimicrobiales bacterium]